MKESRRSCCPVACSLDIFGDRWTLLVVRDLAYGKKYFKEFLASPEGIATNILADRMLRLAEAGVVQKVPQPDQPGRDAYMLTDKGETLVPVLGAVARWGLANLRGTEARLAPKPRGKRGTS
jgi:DNA-binding HxlR family transcriptional regulator